MDIPSDHCGSVRPIPTIVQSLPPTPTSPLQKTSPMDLSHWGDCIAVALTPSPTTRVSKRSFSDTTPSDVAESDSKRQKLSDETAEALPEASGITWSTRWSDLSLVVSNGEDAKPLVRLPVHRFMACQFTVLERALSQPFNATCRSLDMSSTEWGVDVWVRLFNYVYTCPVQTGEGGERFAANWIGKVDSSELDAVVHLVLYLANSSMEEYIQTSFARDGPVSSDAMLAFYLFVSPLEVDNLRTFAQSRNLAGSLSKAKLSVELIFNWLLGPGKLGPTYDWLTEPTETQLRMCQWLFLLVATAGSTDPLMSALFENMRKIASWIKDVGRNMYMEGWFCKVASLLLEFAPCVDHHHRRLVGNHRAPCLSLHRTTIVHSLYRKGIACLDDVEISTYPLFPGGLIWWRWTVDRHDITRRQFFMALKPVSDIWTVVARGSDFGDIVEADMMRVCRSFRLRPVRVEQEKGVHEKAAKDKVQDEEEEEEEEQEEEQAKEEAEEDKEDDEDDSDED